MKKTAVFTFSILFLMVSTTTSFATSNKQSKPTLQQKIGQMLMLGFNGMQLHDSPWLASAIKHQELGGVILFNRDLSTKSYKRNISSPKQVTKLTHQLQQATRQAAKTQHNKLYPLFISIDYEGGKVARLTPRYHFPATQSQQDVAKTPIQEIRKHANQMAKVLKRVGINMNFSPVVDVNVNPNNPIIGKFGRSFSKNPYRVTVDSAIYSNAYYHHGILCSYKHFPGHGSSTKDSHKGFVDISQTWQPKELIPYQALLHQPHHCPMVMVAHLINKQLDPSGLPASLSKKMMTGLLRHKIGFTGIIISDDLQMKAITKGYTLRKALRLSINGGADILLFGNELVEKPLKPHEIIQIVMRDVKEGKIKRSRINDAYQRILATKRWLREN